MQGRHSKQKPPRTAKYFKSEWHHFTEESKQSGYSTQTPAQPWGKYRLIFRQTGSIEIDFALLEERNEIP